MSNRLEIGEHNFVSPDLHGIYTEHSDPVRLAVKPHLPHEDRDALEHEADYYVNHRSPVGGRQLCFEPTTLEGMDYQRIQAYRKIIEDERPDWVERVRDAMRASNWIYGIVAFSGVPPYPAVAIVYNFIDRGDLPEDIF